MSYQQLPMKRVELHELHLDLHNYRIPTPQPNEEAAMRYLLAEEDVLGLGKMILRDGYFDNEVPIVTDMDGALVVLEGNRRVTALKLLNDPRLLPDWTDAAEALLRRYSVEATDLPRAIRVLVASNRAAARHLSRLHTTTPKRNWSRDQQATFYHSLMEQGQSVQAIKTDFPGVSVVRFIKMAEFRRMLAGVKFEDAALHAYVLSPDLKMSVMEYAYRNAGVLAALGVSFDEDGRLNPPGQTAEQVGAGLSAQGRQAVERLIRKVRDDKLDTRSPEFKKDSGTSKANAELVAWLFGGPSAAARPDPRAGDPKDGTDGHRDQEDDRAQDSSDTDTDTDTDADAAVDDTDTDVDDTDTGADDTDDPAFDGQPGGGAGAQSESRPDPSAASNTGQGVGPASVGPTAGQDQSGDQDGSTTGARGPNRPDTRPYLDLGGLDYRTGVSVNLQHRYHELRRLNLADTPAAAAVMLRSVLESSIKYHFESTATPVSGQLSRVFAQVVSTYGSDKPLQASIGRIRSGTADQHGSIQWFNVVTHSADVVVDAKDVHAAYRVVEPVLRRLLRPA